MFEPFGTGVTLASFHLLGTIPLLIDLLNKAVTLGKMALAVALSIEREIPSRPFALVVSIDSKSSRTSSSRQRKSSGHRLFSSLLQRFSPDENGGREELKHSAKKDIMGSYTTQLMFHYLLCVPNMLA